MTLKTLVGIIACAVLRKHRRGKRLMTHTDGIRPGWDKFECPRCGSTWTRKTRKVIGAA